MADRRMFSKKITDSDAFIELSSASQALYFHLNQAADDDGFNNQVQIAMMKAHASVDDLKILMMKNFIIRFENGVIVIKHWRIHNTLRKDRYTPTTFCEELSMLNLKENLSYSLAGDGCQAVARRLPDGCPSIGKDRLGKVSIEKDSKDTADSRAEPADSTPPIITFPLNTGEEYPIFQDCVKEWGRLYPAVDVMQELRNMRGWLIGNPQKRKTKKGILKFVTNWLSREQDKGGNRLQPAQKSQSDNIFLDMLEERKGQ